MGKLESHLSLLGPWTVAMAGDRGFPVFSSGFPGTSSVAFGKHSLGFPHFLVYPVPLLQYNRLLGRTGYAHLEAYEGELELLQVAHLVGLSRPQRQGLYRPPRSGKDDQAVTWNTTGKMD